MPKRTSQPTDTSTDTSLDAPETPAVVSPANPPQGNGGKHQHIEDLAYQRWVERGCPQGSPDEDWFAAERDLSSRE
jgi:DUF2934 family protein